MDDGLSSLLLVAALMLAVVAAGLMAGRAGPPRPGAMTLSMLVFVGLGLGLQLAVPGTLELLQRDAAAIARGEVWRLLTTFFVQDGGLAGGLFNLLWLLLVGSAAERLWSRSSWLLIYLGGGILAELVALAWQPVGGGNSVACFALAGSLLAQPLLRQASLPINIISALGLGVGVGLTLLANIHGAALLIGAAAGLLLAPRT
jgi:membrane associated rhomboid family serine protease